MSVFSELLTPSFLMILAIVFLLLALLVIYFENKFREQNHKIASMLSLVSSLAEELNVLRFNFIHYTNATGGSVVDNSGFAPLVSKVDNQTLIAVSDDEDEEDDEEDEDDDEDEDEDEDDDEEDEEEEDDEEEDVVKLNIGNDVDEEDFVEDNADYEEDEEKELNDIKVLKINLDSQDNVEVLENLEEVKESETIVSKTMDLKTISIPDLEESYIDYRNMSQTKLRNVVLEKGLVTNANKLKKTELLKLLGINE